MVFTDEREASGIPLRSILWADSVAFRFRCTGCRRTTQAPVQAVLAKLRSAGTGDGDTLHTEIAGKLTKPCRGCGKKAWVCELVWAAVAAPRASPKRLNSDGVVR